MDQNDERQAHQKALNQFATFMYAQHLRKTKVDIPFDKAQSAYMALLYFSQNGGVLGNQTVVSSETVVNRVKAR
ncbi:MAG: hypothetical protein WCK54_18320 [Desulfuromonadales bacterium]